MGRGLRAFCTKKLHNRTINMKRSIRHLKSVTMKRAENDLFTEAIQLKRYCHRRDVVTVELVTYAVVAGARHGVDRPAELCRGCGGVHERLCGQTEEEMVVRQDCVPSAAAAEEKTA